jgi:2-methylaconitate cis-trans-isomerase PrpF
VDIKRSAVDYSGSCGNMAAGVGVFALQEKMIDNPKRGADGTVEINVWQKNIGKRIVIKMKCDESLIPITKGDFELFGVPNKYSEIITSFVEAG